MSWLTDTALYTGLLIALVLMLRRTVARMFGPGLAYALWALPLLRLALPPLVLPAKPASDVIVVTAASLAPAPAAAVQAPAWSDALAYAPLLETVWLAGAVLFLVWRTGSYLAMRCNLLRGGVAIGRQGKVRLVESPATPAPVAFGVFDKVVALPIGFMRQPIPARDLAIAHELQHHAGHDLAVNFAMQPLLALHWFNPLAWMGWRALRRDQEAACDARVLAGRDLQARADYARLITSFAKGYRQNPGLALAAPMACPVLGEKSIIHRLRSLTMTEPTKTNRLIGRLLIGAGIIALPLTASVTYAAPDAPAPPAPPTAPDAPTPPDAPQVETRVIMIKTDGMHGDHTMMMGDEAGLTTRTVTRDGRTYVFKTTKPMSDAEVDQRIAEAEQAMRPMPPMPPMPPVAPGAPAAPHQVRTIVMQHDGAGMEAMSMAGPDMAMATCDGGQAANINSDQVVDGKHRVTRIVMCNKGGDKTHTLAALRVARDQVAGDANIPAEAKASALKQLDEQIAKLD